MTHPATQVRRLVLAIETATSDMGAALADESGVLAEVTVCRHRRHAESLHPAIEMVCRESGVALDDLTDVAVDVGPGLFTGLRVGVTTAKVLAATLDLPLHTVTSLDILACAAGAITGPRVTVVPVVDMRRGEVAWTRGAEIRRGTPEDLGAELSEMLDGELLGAADEVLMVGDGPARHLDRILACVGADRAGRLRTCGDALSAPPVRVLATMSLSVAALGRADAAVLVPLYLRDPDVAIGWDSRPARGA